MKTAKSKLPMLYAIEKFIAFLKERSLYDKYFNEFMWSVRPSLCDTLESSWKEWSEQCSQYNWIDSLESISNSAEWGCVNLEWCRELDILNEEYKKS